MLSYDPFMSCENILKCLNSDNNDKKIYAYNILNNYNNFKVYKDKNSNIYIKYHGNYKVSKQYPDHENKLLLYEYCKENETDKYVKKFNCDPSFNLIDEDIFTYIFLENLLNEDSIYYDNKRGIFLTLPSNYFSIESPKTILVKYFYSGTVNVMSIVDFLYNCEHICNIKEMKKLKTERD